MKQRHRLAGWLTWWLEFAYPNQAILRAHQSALVDHSKLAFHVPRIHASNKSSQTKHHGRDSLAIAR